ncbi:unnamed protein product [Ostreobium quekettii]|uniref:Chloride channel protein n=1 Tax=Ostreobium quekettii TaxID=121088 RepID=A0A8S1J850_9CHLO|nr:unnamed protein product [Ostreobium quekettii]|eukprot:evm.model.scf_2202.1 EVM.evm.TU.scf_2202.1   scf_2202:4164-9250(+)
MPPTASDLRDGAGEEVLSVAGLPAPSGKAAGVDQGGLGRVSEALGMDAAGGVGPNVPVYEGLDQCLEESLQKPPFIPDSRYFSPRYADGSRTRESGPATVTDCPNSSAPQFANWQGCSEARHRTGPQLRSIRTWSGSKGRAPQRPERILTSSLGSPTEDSASLNVPLLGGIHPSEGSVPGSWKERPSEYPATRLLPGRCSATPREGELPPGGKATESLDFETVQNTVLLNRLSKEGEKERRFYGYTGRTFVKFVITIVAGVLIGLTAIAISTMSKNMIAWKNRVVMSLCDLTSNQGLMAAVAFHTFYSVGLILLAVFMVQFWAPEAAGAGVSLVMAYLNGSHVPNLFRLPTLITKFVGTICALSANLFLGPEGPMVHIGAAITSAMTYPMSCCKHHRTKPAKLYISAEPMRPNREQTSFLTETQVMETDLFLRTWSKFSNFVMELYTDLDRRDLLSAGAGSGIAAAFGAPIGGVLFAMEEAATYWSKKVAWRCFLCCVAAVCSINIVHAFVGPRCSPGERSVACTTGKVGMLSFEKGADLEEGDWLRQTPFILGISIIAGLIGVAFNSLRVNLWRFRAPAKRHMLRMAEAMAVALITVVIMFVVSGVWGRCRKILDKSWEEEHAYLQFNCEKGQHNDLASAFMASPEVTVKRLFSLGSNYEQQDMHKSHEKTVEFYNSHFTIESLAIFVPFYLIVMSLGAGIAIPGGLFLPAIMVGGMSGALYGRLMGTLAAHFFGYLKIQPGFYALLGATGSLASVFRSSISLVVIVIEGTRNIDYLFGVVLAVVVSNWVAHHVHHDGIYESEVERAGNVHFLKPEPPRALFFKTAETVMVANVQTLRTIEKVSHVLTVLRDTTHNGFPVVEKDTQSDRRAGRLEGLILRSQLLVLLRRRVFCSSTGKPATTVDEEAIDAEMRHFYSLQHTHHRFMATTDKMVDALELDWVHGLLTPRAATEEQGGNGSFLESPVPAATIASSSFFLSPFAQLAPLGEALAGNLYMDLRPYMNRAPLTVRQECCAARAYEVFTSLGLRHLCVVNDHNEVAGIITRKDLDHASGLGWWRHNKMAPSPERQQSIAVSVSQLRLTPSRRPSANDLASVHSAEFISRSSEVVEDGQQRPRSVI